MDLSLAAASGGWSTVEERGLLIAVASLPAEHGLQGTWAVVAVSPGL